jgi:hypothetical protein
LNRARWIRLPFVIAALTQAPHAFAQDDKAAAEALFDEAKKLMAAKHYSEACPKFADSQRLDPGVGTLLNLGLCYKQTGQTASAWSAYREAASLARSEGQNDREELARQEATALDPQLTKLVIEVPPETARIPGLEIKRDGGVVPDGLWGVAAPVDPGVQKLDITAPNKKPLHLEAKAQGAGATSKIVIPPLEDGPPPPVAAGAAGNAGGTPPPPPDQGGAKDEHPGRTQRIIGYSTVGAGVLVGGVGVWFTLLSVAENKAANETTNPEHKAQHQSDSQSARTIGFVGIGIGAAAVIGGIVIVVTAPHGPQGSALTLTPQVAQGGGGLALGGRF